MLRRHLLLKLDDEAQDAPMAPHAVMARLGAVIGNDSGSVERPLKPLSP